MKDSTTPESQSKNKFKDRVKGLLPNGSGAFSNTDRDLSEDRKNAWKKSRQKIRSFIQQQTNQFGSSKSSATSELTDSDHQSMTIAELEQHYKTPSLDTQERNFDEVGERRINFPPPADQDKLHSQPTQIQTGIRSEPAKSIGQILQQRIGDQAADDSSRSAYPTDDNSPSKKQINWQLVLLLVVNIVLIGILILELVS